MSFKHLRNLTQRKIQKAKREFITDQLDENQSQPKKLWKNLKELGTPSKSKSNSSNIGLKSDNGEIIFENEFVANRFNSFFYNIAQTLVDKLQKRDFDEK